MAFDISQLSNDELEVLSSGDQTAWARTAARRHGVPDVLVEPVIKQESRGKQSAVSPKGAKGVMQLMPGTAKDLGVDPNDWAENIWGGMQYLGEQFKKFNDPDLALAAYNAGPGRVKGGKVPNIKETKDYVKNITDNIDVSKLSNEELLQLAGGAAGGTVTSAFTEGKSLEGMADNFTSPLNKMAEEYYQATGRRLKVNDAFRTKEQQEEAYRKKPGLAAKPGHSLHEKGMALDIDEAQANELDKMGLLEKHGFFRPMMSRESGKKYEPWHIQLAEGDIEKRASATAASVSPDLSKLSNEELSKLDAELSGLSNAELRKLAGMPEVSSEGEVKTGTKLGLVDIATTAARAIDPLSAMTGAGIFPGPNDPVWDAPQTREARAIAANQAMTQGLFPEGVPPEKTGYVNWLTRDLARMWPQMVGLITLGGYGAPAELLGTGLLGTAARGAVPFGMMGLTAENPALGAAEGVALGGTLGVMHSLTGKIPGFISKWISRIAGGAAIGGGAAALQGADANEIKKNAVLFALFEAVGMPRDERAAAAEKVPDSFKDELLSFADKTEEAIRGYDAMSYPSTFTPGTVAVTTGKGKRVKTVDRQSPAVEQFPSEEKLTPASMELITKAAGRERQLEIDKAGTQWSREKGRFLDEPENAVFEDYLDRVEKAGKATADQWLEKQGYRSPLAMYSAGEKPFAPIWRSKMQEFIGDKLPGMGTGSGLANTVRSWAQAGHIKKDELKWSGLLPWLEGQEGKVAKQQVVDYLKGEGQVEVREVVRQVPAYDIETGKYKHDAPTKFESYMKLPPGGDNYREFLLTVPRKEVGLNLGELEEYERLKTMNARRPLEGSQAEELRQYERRAGLPGRDGYTHEDVFRVLQSHSYGDPAADINRFAHVFTDDRIIDGKKYLTVWELQSDWVGKGRREGYRKPEITVDDIFVRKATPEELAENQSLEKYMMEWREKRGIPVNAPVYAAGLKSTGKVSSFLWDPSKADAASILREAKSRTSEYGPESVIDTAIRESREGVPQFPFQKNWMEVSLKKMLRKAAEEGYDGVAWATGDMVKERYDLSKQVDKIMAARQEDGTFNLVAYPVEYRGSEDVVHIGGNIPANKLSDYVPKELASKISTQTELFKNYEGEDLKIGGEWANRQYDQMMPQFLGKYGKQWGGKVGEGNLLDDLDNFEIFQRADGRYEIDKMNNEGEYIGRAVGGIFDTREAAEKAIYGLAAKPIHTFGLTPEMKKSVLYEGQPMFRDSRGKPVPQVVNEETINNAFGGVASVKKMGDGDFLAQLPSGANIRIFPNADIVVDPDAWMMAYQRPYRGEVPYGQWTPLNYGGVIKLAKEGQLGTLNHEVFHAAMDLALTEAERAEVLKHYGGNEEVAARAYEEWNPIEQPHTLFEKIMNFFGRIWKSMFPDAESIFERIQSGEVWKEPLNERERAEYDKSRNMYSSGLTDAWNTLKEKAPVVGKDSAFRKLLHETRRMFAPETLSKEGMQTAQDWTKAIGLARASVLKAAKTMQDYRVQFANMPYDDRWQLSAKMERGEAVPKEWQPYAKARQDAFNAAHQQISRIREGAVGYINNYAPHLYADPDKAAVFFDTIGRRPLEGKKGFLKGRVLPDMDTARKAGLEPLFDNPMQQDMAGLMEQWRYVAGNDFISSLEKRGLFIPVGKDGKPTKPVPEGWIKTDQKVFRNGYAPRNAIDVIHNHLMSERGGLWYNTWRNMTAAWNAWHVTLSAFHGMTTLVHETSMGFGHGIPEFFGALMTGDHSKAFKAARSVGPLAVVNTFKMAKKGKEAFYDPGKHGPHVDNLVKIATEGGMLPEHTMLMEGIAADSFKELATQFKGGEIGRAFRSLTHLLGKPIMGYLVPTVKYGSTLIRIERELNNLRDRYQKQHGTNWSPEVEANFTKDVGNIAYNERQFSDNIFGEIHPDNMHWDRGMSKWLKGLIAYPGWNIGTLRWMGGVGRGLAKTATGQKLDYQARSSLQFGLGLFATVGLANTLLHMALNNGQEPEDWQDVLVGARTGRYLNNGSPERVTIASYMKDIAAMGTHPGRALLSKMQAPFTMFKELWDNADYYGTEIVPARGTIGDKAAGLGKYLGEKALPFGASQVFSGKSPITQYGGFVGFRTVPRALVSTKAQNRIDEVLQQQSPRTRTKEAAETSRTVAELKDLGWNDNRSEMEEGIRKARDEGKITAVQADHIRKDTLKDKRVVQFRKLRFLEDMLDVYELGSPEERDLWRTELVRKWSRATGEMKQKLRSRYNEVMDLPYQREEKRNERKGFSIADTQ